MKKLNYFLLGLAGLTLASCSQDDLLNGGDFDGNYRVTIELPADMATRAIGDNATAASLLNYAIFDMGGTFIDKGTANFPDGQTSMTLNLNLAAGASFQIAFFAQSPESTDVYSFNATADAHSITVNYDNMNNSAYNNADDYDCFYKLFNTGAIGSSDMQTQVVLNRLVAQINWGTNELYSTNNAVKNSVTNTYGATLQNLNATLTASVYNEFDLITQEVKNAEEVTIGEFKPSTEAFPITGYNYVAMQYVLVPAAQGVYNLDLAINNGGTASNTITVANAPVQANYRTNIYGSLLSETVEFNVELSADWGTPSHNYAIWDGVTKEVPVANADGVFEIMTPAQWIGLPEATVPATSKSISNANVKLGANLDFAGYTIAPLEFTGTIDGQGYTISNVTFGLAGGYASGLLDNQAVGGNITVENLTLSNVKAVNHSFDSSNAWGYTGAVIGALQNNATLTLNNVNVVNANLDGIQSVGGLVGFVASGTTVNISNCSVSDSYLTNIPYVNESGFVAGLVGRPNGTVNILDGNSVSNTEIVGYWASRRGENSIAAVVGGQDVTNVETTGVKVTAIAVTTDITINGTTYSTLEEALANVQNGQTINLGLATYNAPVTLPSNKTFTIAGMGQGYSIIQYPLAYATAEGSSIILKDLTISAAPGKGTSMGFQESTSGTYTNVEFIGEFHAFPGNNTFSNCTFNQDPSYNNASGRYGLWIEFRTEGTTTVSDCTFNNFLAKGILVYNNSSSATNLSTMGDINISNCSFSANASYKNNAAIEIHSENFKSAGTIRINDCTYNNAYSALWQEKNNNTGIATKFYTVYVNGVEKQLGTQTAQ